MNDDHRLTMTMPFSCRQDERQTAEPEVKPASSNAKQTRGWSLTCECYHEAIDPASALIDHRDFGDNHAPGRQR